MDTSPNLAFFLPGPVQNVRTESGRMLRGRLRGGPRLGPRAASWPHASCWPATMQAEYEKSGIH